MAITNYYTFNGAIRGENQVGETGYRAYGSDVLGSVAATFDSTGTLQDSCRYSPYGRSILSTGSTGSPAFLWGGSLRYRNNAREFFEYYVRARHYSASLAIWTTIDIIWPRQPQFGYAASSPLKNVDPSGLSWCTIWAFRRLCVGQCEPTYVNSSIIATTPTTKLGLDENGLPITTMTFSITYAIEWYTFLGRSVTNPMTFKAWEYYYWDTATPPQTKDTEINYPPHTWYSTDKAPGFDTAVGKFPQDQINYGCDANPTASYVVDHPGIATGNYNPPWRTCTCQLLVVYDYANNVVGGAAFRFSSSEDKSGNLSMVPYDSSCDCPGLDP